MTEVVCEFTAPGPPEFRQKAEKVKITVGSRRENFPYETSVEFKNICTRPKKKSRVDIPMTRSDWETDLFLSCCFLPKFWGSRVICPLL